MSLRIKLTSEDKPSFGAEPPGPRRRWGLAVSIVVATLAASAAIAVCGLSLHTHETHCHDDIAQSQALGYVKSFMTEFTSPDPFHANDYADRILGQATGEFAGYYRRHQNEILVGIARSEPTTGTILDAGISRRNGDGSFDVMLVTKLTAKSTDGALQLERTSRWVVTTRREGERWKISDVNPLM